MDTPPILLLAFNRPDTTHLVIDAIRPARPKKVYFAVDGARAGKAGEAEAVAAVQALAGRMDWGCEVRRLFRDRNLGCKAAVSQAISWFFDAEESGIVLEDDCVAHPSFFPFAAELLERHRQDERVLMISGDNFQRGVARTPYSYYFSRYTHIWGWASWRRAWAKYDHEMTAWPELRDGGWLADLLEDRGAVEYWTAIFEATYGNRNTSWAYRWLFAAWRESALSILPNVNLISNIGFDERATHTVGGSLGSGQREMRFPLSHPPYLIRDARADEFTQHHVFLSRPAGWRRAAGMARRILGQRKK